MQVLKNLLSNAFKFTEKGGVRVNVLPALSGWNPNHPALPKARQVIAFEVADTGIGIPPEKQKIIFEAFQQADASTSRKYGGTGLGLAISRELAYLLGGEIQLRSTPGAGSTFTLYLPVAYVGPNVAQATAGREEATSGMLRLPAVRIQERQSEPIPDDRNNIQPGDTTLLIVEDEPSYCQILVEMAHGSGFKVLVAMRGADALELAHKYHPTAVSLDVFLPDMLGWTVLSQLKQDPATRHIPVQIVTLDEDRQHGLARGAFSFITKPTSPEGLKDAMSRIKGFASPRTRRLLVVEDEAAEQMSIRALLEHDDIEMESASSGEEALKALHERAFDCVVLDLRLPDISGFEVLERLSKDEPLRDLPIVVFTGKELTPDEDARLHSIARSIVVKGVESPERLLDETALFLHRVVANLPTEKQQMIERLHRSDDDLVGKPVLVVDDDVRNIFALSSVLERRGMKVVSATTGHEAMALLDSTPDVSIVLMDIMMPEMDGYQTIKYIRQNPKHRRLPIIALTAKAMKGDREKCLEAGASEYLAKPVNTEQLLSALRMWLHR
jgi:CheY-like chemotaxis protein